MNRRPIDTLALWYSLKPEIQALVGATAIAAELSLQGSLAAAENIPTHLPISERAYWLGESDRFEKAGLPIFGPSAAAGASFRAQ